MLTRETAIERLRATGTLATEQQQQTLVAAPAHVSAPITRMVGQIMMSNARVIGQRHVAPAASQAVLP